MSKRIYSQWVDGNPEITLGTSHKRCWNCDYRVLVEEAVELDTCPNCGATMVDGLMQAISDVYNERMDSELKDLEREIADEV